MNVAIGEVIRDVYTPAGTSEQLITGQICDGAAECFGTSVTTSMREWNVDKGICYASTESVEEAYELVTGVCFGWLGFLSATAWWRRLCGA
jgi:hypothetical protein